ncbi:MAG: hypothetical protein SGJ02_08920 [bacterium]|nr:hypothetical protein [bacterium]
MSKFISRFFGTYTPTISPTALPIEIQPELNSPETVLKEVAVNALSDFKNPISKKLLVEAVTRNDIALPTLIYVHLADNMAVVTEITFTKKFGSDDLPILAVKAAKTDPGKVFDKDVFVSDEAVLDLTAEEISEKIKSGEIGSGTCFLAGCTVCADAIFGMNVIVGPGAKIFGGVFGDNVVLGRNAWIGHEVEIASGVLIGAESSLNGKISIGFSPENETGVEPSRVLIGDSCAFDQCTIGRNTIIGKHCLVENNPNFSGIIPDGATVVGSGSSFSIVPF